MTDQTTQQAAPGSATPEAVMAVTEATPSPAANPQAPQAVPAVDPVIEMLQDAGVSTRGITTREEALEKVRNLNSLVGDESVATQRRIAKALSAQTNLSEQEVADVLESGGNVQVSQPETPEVAPVSREVKLANERVAKLLVKDLVRDIPEAKAVQDKILARSLQTGLDPEEVWAQEFQPILKAGMEQGAKKLQSTMAAQPTQAVSTQTETTTTLDVKKMSSAEMRKHLPIAPSR